MLTVASVRIAWHAESRTARLLGEARSVGAPSLGSTGTFDEARRLGRAVERVAAVLPWQPVCLQRALAVGWMLRRRGIDYETHLGITDAQPPSAHAWVTVDGGVVQGAPIDDVTELARFV
jgi:hypothetical protein